MPKTQVIYNQVGMFIGPAPSSGYHFLSSEGELNNNFEIATENHNLIFPLRRVTSSSYSIQPPREEIFHMGGLDTIKRPVLQDTTVDLNFEYNSMGLVNEARMGFYLNIPTGHPVTGDFRYGAAGKVYPLSGFYTRDLSRDDNPSSLNWPLLYRDRRNIFITTKKDSLDLINYSIPNSADTFNTYAFGDCYLNSYTFSVGLGKFPRAAVRYVCNNVEVHSSGSGLGVPAISPQNQETYSGIKFNIPPIEGNDYRDNTVLTPSDITLSIKQNNTDSIDLSNSLVDFTDIKIQNLTFGFDLNRKPLYGIGYKYPLDKTPIFPIVCDVTFDCMVGDAKASSLTKLLKEDNDYDIILQFDYHESYEFWDGFAMEYKFLKSKFKNFESSISTVDKKNAQFSFTTDMDPDDSSKGLFIRGHLGVFSWEELLLYDQLNEPLGSLVLEPPTGYLRTESDGKIILGATSSGAANIVVGDGQEEKGILVGYESFYGPDRPHF